MDFIERRTAPHPHVKETHALTAPNCAKLFSDRTKARDPTIPSKCACPDTEHGSSTLCQAVQHAVDQIHDVLALWPLAMAVNWSSSGSEMTDSIPHFCSMTM
jgi:hypothetical protein